MNENDIKSRLLDLLGSKRYMPMRKRGIARELDVSEEDYRDFRVLLESLVKRGEIVELKRGKFGLPRDEDRTRTAALNFGTGKSNFAPPPARTQSFSFGDSRDDDDTEEVPARHDSDEEEEEESKPPVSVAEPKSAAQLALPKHAKIGRIEVKRGGMGFLLSDPPGNDTFIAAEDLMGAMGGDLVAVEMKRRPEQRRNKGRFGYGGGGGFSKPVGRVIRIIERAHPRIVGTFYSQSRRGEPPEAAVGRVVPDARGVFEELEVLPKDRGDAKDKDKVAVELIEAKTSHRSGGRPTARVVKVFGPAGNPEADIGAILENFNIKTSIPEEVLRAAEEVPDTIPDEELAKRIFYEQPITFTIDPADAKDHDDAVAIQRMPEGKWLLLVHIADVAYYVPEGSVIDVEARDRATSVYLPGTVYPMLPPKLSNNMCSLKEGQLRLTKTARMVFDKNMNMESVRIDRSYIRSAAFLTYDQVKQGLDDNRPDVVRSPEIFETLKVMKEFAMALRAKRLNTGSLELELPEARLLLDEKLEVKGWTMTEHHWAHELIEDMMLAANRAVAEYMVEHEIPGLYRIHEEPDPEALKRFGEFVREFGISLRPPIDRLKLKSVLDRVKGKEDAHSIHLALLTSLKQARYSPEALPHFALNFNRYLHFTSPIRRYPDLVVHRALDERFEPGQKSLPLHGKKRAGGEQGAEYLARVAALRPLAAHCSVREREAGNAEEEVIKFKQMQFLRRNMKEAHPGLITRVRDFGLFVVLQDCYVEGLVRVQDLTDDYYEYFEDRHLLQGRRHHRSFQLGDKVSVRIAHMDLGKKEVDLEIV